MESRLALGSESLPVVDKSRGRQADQCRRGNQGDQRGECSYNDQSCGRPECRNQRPERSRRCPDRSEHELCESGKGA